MSRNSHGFYQGCDVSDKFLANWRSGRHTGASRPVSEVWLRRIQMKHAWHYDWPNPQFGQVFGQSIRRQWYPDWIALDDWMQVPGVQQVDLDQSFANNGITSATLSVDNVRWNAMLGLTGDPYHSRERGYLWPWKGYRPPKRPGFGAQNEWYLKVPNAQILVKQGYGPATMAKTFTGLVDNLDGTVRPDRLVIASRDFGGVLTDCDVFGWNKTRGIFDPIVFAPHNYERFKWARRQASQRHHRWIIIKDITDVVRCVLRWSGFKDWEIEDAGVNLSVPYTVDKSKTMMDVINDIGTALGYTFFMGEPNQTDDMSVGVPIFRRPSVLVPKRSLPITLTSKQHLTDVKPKHSNKDDRYIIRVRGAPNKKVGRKLAGDSIKRVTFTYWPPWHRRMAGVIKQLTYYNIGSKDVKGFQTKQQCMVAALLIAVQIALGRDTATLQCAGNPGFGLDSFAYVMDEGSGINSRLYVTNRKSTLTLGGDGSGAAQAGSSGELLWASELGGALVDNSEWEKIVKDYEHATHGGDAFSEDAGFT